VVTAFKMTEQKQQDEMKKTKKNIANAISSYQDSKSNIK
jgi:hypothetical protein